MIRTKRALAHRLLNEINITPFCDVLLVLLIIFMVTAQSMTHEASQNIQLPKASTQETTFPQVLTIRIDKDQQITVNNQPATLDTLGAKIKAIHDQENIGTMVVRADKGVPYQIVYTTMDIASQNGVDKIALAGEHQQ